MSAVRAHLKTRAVALVVAAEAGLCGSAGGISFFAVRAEVGTLRPRLIFAFIMLLMAVFSLGWTATQLLTRIDETGISQPDAKTFFAKRKVLLWDSVTYISVFARRDDLVFGEPGGTIVTVTASLWDLEGITQILGSAPLPSSVRGSVETLTRISKAHSRGTGA